MKALKNSFLIIYISLSMLMFSTFNASILIWSSFFLNALLLTTITIYHLYYEKGYSPFLSSFIVFTFLFFIAAPIVQIDSFYGVENPRFVHFFPFKEHLVVYANILIFIFNFTFIIFYILFKRKYKFNTKEYQQKAFLPFTILIISIVSFFIFMLSINFVLEEFNRPSWLKSSNPVYFILLWKKFLFFIPFSGIILCFQYFKKKNKLKANFLNIIIFLFFLIIVLLWFKNPLIEKRNALGPIYITLIFLFIPKLLNSNIKTTAFLFFSMIILFPLTAILTHSDATLLEMYNNPVILLQEMEGGGITKAFTTLNYDAFANITATIELVHNDGFSFGYQLLGGLLFFIPRGLWVSKPVSSGEMIGDYLVGNYNYSFTNLSNSFLTEGFLNFGVLGVVFFAIILAYIIIRFISWLNSDNYLKKVMAFYFSIHLIFFLRGDFTNGFSYYVGPLLAVMFAPKIIEIITKELIYLRKKHG